MKTRASNLTPLSLTSLALIVSAALAGTPSLAAAASYYGGGSTYYGNADSLHNHTVGGGVSSASETPRERENPAALVFNQGPKIQVSVDSAEVAADSPNTPNAKHYSQSLGNRFQFYTGNKFAGGTLGVETFNNVSDSLGSLSYLNFGLATFAETIDTSIGLSGTYRFVKPGQGVGPKGENTWTANLGAIFNPHGTVRVGANAYGIDRGFKAVGAGLSVDVNAFSTLSFDASTSDRFNGTVIKPAIGVVALPFMISYGYGMRVGDTSNEFGITSGNTLSLGMQFTPGFRLEASYNQATLFHLGASIAL